MVMLGALALPAFTSGIGGANAHLDMPSLAAVGRDVSAAWAWLTAYSPASPWGKLPTEPSGTAAGHPHEVPAAATRADHGNGHAPAKVPDGLPPYQPLKPKVARGLSGRAISGYSARTSVLVARKSTATSDYYRNADGSVTRTLAATPINYETSPGNWMPIEPALVRAAGGRWREKANSVQVSIGGSAASAGLESVGLSGHVATVGLAGAAPVKPAVSGATITYRGALPATDLVATATTVGVASSLVLHSARAPSSWMLPLRLTGLRPKLMADGGVSLTDAAGSRVAVIPAATATDAAAATGAVSYRLTTHDGAPSLLMTLPSRWLTAAARQFPVTVETGISAYQDTAGGTTFADTIKPGDNSTSQTIAIGARDGGVEKANSFLDISDQGLQGSGVDVMSAALQLSLIYATTCKAEQLDVAPVSRPWTPSTVTSYPGPAHGAAIGSLSAMLPAKVCGKTPVDPSASDPLTVRLSTPTFQGWANGTTPDNGLEVYAPTTDNLHWKQFTSVYSEFPPVLTLTYVGVVLPSVSAQAPPDGTVVTTLTPRLTAYGQIDSGLGRKPEFDFQIDSASGAKVADSGLVTATTLGKSSFFGPASWTVPVGKLHWGQSYYWTVQAYDGTNYSPGAVWNSLTVQVPQPVISSLLSQNTSGHGVDPVVGNYTTSATDADVATVGPSLTVERDYNSLDPRVSGSFGAGWSSIFDGKAAEQYNDAGGVSSVVVTNPDGSAVGFGKNPNGTFSPPEGTFSTLRTVSGGGYTFTDKDDTVYSFRQSLGSGSYGITSVTDAEGRSLDFTWSGGHITTMASAVSGRALHLNWTVPQGAKDAHVVSVTTDPVTAGAPNTALTWTYGYDGDQLASVCAPGSGGKCTRYSYTPGSDFYDAVLDENPQSYWPLSETSGSTAHSAVLAHEGSDDGTYSNVDLGQPGPLVPQGTGTAAGFNGTSSSVALPNLDEGAMPDQTIALWFKTTKPGVIFSYSDDPIAACPPPDSCGTIFDPALYIGSDGKLNASLWEDVGSSGKVPTIETSAPVDDGRWHFVVVTGSAAQQVLYVSGLSGGTGITRVGTGPGSTSVGYTTGDTHLTHPYLGAGFLGGLWPDQPSHSVTVAPVSYFNGSIADAAFYASPLSAAAVNLLYQVGTTPASLLGKVTRPSGSVYATVAYDPLTARVTSLTDENGGDWKLSAPSVSGSSQVYRTAVLSAHPVDYYRVGDPAGTAVALNQVHGGTATYFDVMLGVPGRFSDSTAASFNGSSSRLDLPPGLVTGHGDQSVSLWFKTTKPGTVLFGSSQAALASGSTTANYVPELYIGANGQLEGEFWTGTAKPITSRAAVDDGQWHYVVLAAGTTSQVMYLDGVEVGTLAGPVHGTGEDNAYVGSGFISGHWPNSPHPGSGTARPAYFNGSVGDVAFYDSQLSKPQALAEYQAARGSNGMTPVTTVTLTDPGGKLITDQYDPLNANRMIAAIDALGDRTTYGYDTYGYLHTVTNPDGDVSTTVNDPRGNVIATTTCQDQAADKCSTVYETYYPNDTSAQLTTPDPRNDQVLTIRDGRSSSATDPAYETSYSYDSHGNVTAVTTPPVPGFPHGQTTSITYSNGTSAFPAADSGNVPAGLPVKTVSPGGATQTISYFHDGDVAETTNADRLVTKYTYDNLGRVLTETQFSDSYPRGLATSYSYDGQNRVLTETDPPVTNRVTGVTHTAKTATSYDPDGDILCQTVSDLTGRDRLQTIRYTYTRYDQVATSTDADGNTTSYTYDAYGNKATETDPDGNETAYTYDPNGDLLDTIGVNFTGNPADRTPPIDLVESSRAYDPAGRLASITDAAGNKTTYTYTDNGLLATTTESNASGTSHYVTESDSYDAAGNLISSVTANGATVTDYTVDAADRNTGETLDPTGVDRVTTVSYDPDDLPAVTAQTSAAGATEVTSETYDPMGNLASRTVYSDAPGHPVGWWPLNQTSGDAVQDESGTGNIAAATGVTWASDGAASFAGTAGQQIATSGRVLKTTGSYSVSAWVNLAAIPAGFQTAVSQDAAENSGFYLQYDGADRAWAFAQVATDKADAAGIRAHASSRPSAKTWYDLTGTYDAATGVISLYVNGKRAGTATNKAPIASAGPLAIGRAKFNGAPTDLFHGQIADVQAYNRVLSSSEAAALYAKGRGGGTVSSSKPMTTTWTLDQRGLPTAMTDQDGNVTTYVYDAAGQLAQTSQPAVPVQTDGGPTVMANPVSMAGYNTFGDQTQTEDPDGNVTTTAYDGDGNAVSQTLPSYTAPGSSTPIRATSTNVYDGDGNLVKQTDPLGNVTTNVYDQLGDLTSTTAPNGGVTSYTYDNDGNKTSMTGPTGARTQYTYDYLDRMVTSTVLERYPSPQALITSYAYTSSASDPGGAWLSSMTSPDGVQTSYGYDAAGEETSQTNGAGNTTSYRYDFLGRQTAVVAPDGTAQTVSYNALGNPVTLENLGASGNVLTRQTATYDGDGDMLSATDPRGDTTTFSYDATGMLTAEVQPVSAASDITTSFGYDAAGNETRFTDGRGNSWIYTYNPWNLQQSEIEPPTSAYSNAADSTFTTAYDADGRPVTQNQPGGVTVTDAYDSVGDLTGQSGTGADAPTATRTYGYDLAGDMTSASTSSAGWAQGTSESFTYNDRSEVLTASGTAGSSSFTYNGDGLVRTATTAAGTTGYTYDDDDRLATMTDPATGTILGYGYNNDSELTSINYGLSGDVQTYGYNQLHELTSDTLTTPQDATAASISYGYDADGNLTSKDTTGLAGASDNTYTYDEANRLTSWDNGTATTDYAYDASGNRTQVGDTTYTYNARDELTSGGGATYGYTANGTLATTTTANGTVRSTFDAYGQQITDGSERYTYDALDRNTSITTTSQNDQGTMSQNGTAPRLQLTFAGLSDDITSDGTSTFTWTPDGTLTGIGVVGAAGDGVLAMTDQHTDVVGDFTPSGGLTGSTAYDPLGNVIATSGNPAGKLGYQSDLTDPVTGKVEMGDRWYNPATGNFTSKDTTAGAPDPNSVAANPFAYAGDSPLVNVDPTGNGWFSDVWHAVTHVAAKVVHAVVAPMVSVVTSVARAAARIVVRTVVDVASTTVAIYRAAAHVVAQTTTKLYNGAKQLASTAWHETVSVAKAGATFVKAHATAIASFAAAAAVFIGCDAVTAGVGTIGCAAVAGAVGNLVSYGMSCGSSTGGCTVGGALTSALSGAAAGAVGYVLGGPFGGKIASDLLGDVLPGVAIRGLTGAVAGATAGTVANAASYGGGCLQGDQCTWSGFGGAVASGAAGGAITGGLLGAVTPESPAEGPADPAASGDPGSSGDPAASPEGEPTSSDDAGAAKASPGPAGGAPEEPPEEQTEEQPQACQIGGESFTASTRVLLASGAAVAISALKPGDKVLAVNTATGKTQAEKVAAVLVHPDTDLYDLTVTSGGRTEVIHTTSNHLFWDPAARAWVKAAALHKGETLRAPRGLVTADGGRAPADRTGWMWDLTIPGDHDFYVMSASRGPPVLVHNINEKCGTEVPYNSGGLSTEAYNARVNADSSNFPVGPNIARPRGNVAVATVQNLANESETETVQIPDLSAPGKSHSEVGIMAQIDALNSQGGNWKITALYSEREPCLDCETALSDYLADNAEITWSVPWSDNDIINAGANRTLATFIRRQSGGL